MKKLILAISVILGSLSLKAYAGPLWKVPEGDSQQILQTADYGGVDYATSAFSIGVTTVTYSTTTALGQFLFYGVNFSTGNCGGNDFVDVWDSTSPSSSFLINQLAPTVRLYNLSGSTNIATAGNNGSCGGYVPAGPRPIRIRYGLWARPSTAVYNMINIQYWRRQD